jgi:type I restriction enzyme S subunit
VISPRFQEQIKTNASSTTLPILNKSKFCVLPFVVCSLPEQREIVRLLDEQFEVIERNEREIDAALRRSEALRQAILKKAFTGHLVPQDFADESARVLLARLRAQKQPEPIRQSKKNA